MTKPSAALLASLALATALAGCTPGALQAAVQAGMAANGGASAAPGTAASQAPAASAAPTVAPSVKPSAAAGAGATVSADVAAIAGAFMDAVDEAAAQSPELVARLFVTAVATYDTDRALGKAMMGYALRSNLHMQSPASPTGYEPQNSDQLTYFRAIEKNTKIGRYYLDAEASGDLPFTEMAGKVVFDPDYAAVDKGLSADGKQWTFYVKVNHPNNVRPRPLRLQMDGDRGWRISNYSSLMVLP